ncbi:TIM barrel protein [Paenibacillus sacheonensis]|uniref:TIM barrel protein n=1 Tax=Paenibacillus sacheonensis TaxID=742054 RepID=A0A7X5BZK5_9BACL|nr:TIM barrel protein [Paenibacillus sacheonensis]MBM7563141.1 sugar phosphate isomerase/epimerase [Paenibacillus sacheonensis]NBC68295.1 TIM barrel protein [Paenibacillus sacheonensis]
MKRFMIGQYGGFDETKYRRDFRDDFYGIEACLFGTQEDVRRLIQESQRNGFRIGIHFPLQADGTLVRDALFLARDEAVRNRAFEWMERELEASIPVRPAYILFHYPKPVILDDRVDWSSWRFADPSEYVWESQYSMQQLEASTAMLFDWLTKKGEEYAFIPVLEFDGLNRYIYETDFLERMLHLYPRIRLCLDTGRLYLQDRIDPYFDARAVIRKFAKYAETIHLKNMRIAGKIVENHYPALPGLKPEDGWAPVEEYLVLIKKRNPHVKIVFEHRSELVSDEELNACYDWINRLLDTP